VLNEMLGKSESEPLPSSQRRLDAAADMVVDGLLFVDEAYLRGPVQGTSSFAADFARAGRRDSKGRSLRDLDLRHRILRYPLSWLIYSETFDALPAPLLERIYSRVLALLTAKEPPARFAHLSAADRRAMLEILLETKPSLPPAWRDGASS
jgi:hypothetical protein